MSEFITKMSKACNSNKFISKKKKKADPNNVTFILGKNKNQYTHVDTLALKQYL